MVEQPGLCRTWSETPKTGFLTTRLKYFLWGLLKSKQQELAILIDKHMTENLEKAGETGMVVGTVENPSLIISTKTLHEWKFSQESVLGQPQLNLQPDRVEAALPLNGSLCQNIEDLSSKINDPKHLTITQDKTAPWFECSPCNRNECLVTASHYCRECCDYLCYECEDVHKRLRMTQSHHTMMIKTHVNVSQNETNLLSCTCGMKQAEFYCQ